MSPPTTSIDAFSSPDLGVYVHVPFCERVCPYCDFAVAGVGRLEPALERRYVSALRAELERWSDPRPLASIYLGGGTPSMLTPDSVATLLGAIRERFAGEPAEVTLELNPGALETRRLAGFRDAGVTRVSVGVQSLHDHTLKRLGRAQSAAEAAAGLEAVLAAGFASLSADLMLGVPDQAEAELLADLERLCDLGVPHLSMYALTLEPGTPFERAHGEGRLVLPDEDDSERLARLVRARAAAAGLEQYEISSYARPGHRALHNQRYWARDDVLGIGVSAASLLRGRRFQNTRSLPEWYAAVESGASPLAESATLSAAEARAEAMFLGFRRLQGVSRADFRRRYGGPPERWFAPALAELRALGLVADRAGRIELTALGTRFADEVFARFLDP